MIVGEALGLAPVLENRQLPRQATQTPRDLKSLRITRSSSLRTLQRALMASPLLATTSLGWRTQRGRMLCCCRRR